MMVLLLSLRVGLTVQRSPCSSRRPAASTLAARTGSSARKQPSSGSVTPTRAFFPADDVKATETAAVHGYMTPSPGSKGSYKYTDRKFMTVHFYHDEDLNSDVMTCTSRPNVPMADDTVEEILADVHDVLRMSRKSHSKCRPPLPTP